MDLPWACKACAGSRASAAPSLGFAVALLTYKTLDHTQACCTVSVLTVVREALVKHCLAIEFLKEAIQTATRAPPCCRPYVAKPER